MMKNVFQYRRQNLFDVVMMMMLLIVMLLRYKIIHFGLPYSLHPDETYIYKDALKILLLYKDFDFSQSYNLVYWLMAAWTGVMYGVGNLLGLWSNFAAFQDALMIEDGTIILGYRCLSLLVSMGGILVLYKLCHKLAANKLLASIFVLTFALNPIEIISDSWIKYDPFVFFTFSILLYFSYEYIILGQKNKAKIIYILSFISLTVRIDFMAFLVAFFLFDFYVNFFRNRTGMVAFLRQIFPRALIGTLVYCVITLLPVSYIYKHFFSSTADMGIASSFEEIIFTRLMGEITSGAILSRIWNNIVYYVRICLYGVGPLIMLCAAVYFFRHKNSRFYLLFILLAAFPITLFGSHAMHYVLSISVVLIFITCLFISRIQNFKMQIILSCLNLLFISSISIVFFIMIFTLHDPRIESIGFILKNTGPGDLIAVETHSSNGLGPPLNECRDVLMEKYKTVSEIGGGTGQTYLRRAQSVGENCRTILDISGSDYFKGSRYENFWINTYDTVSFAQRNPEFYITTYSLAHGSPFYDYLLNNYALFKRFSTDVPDKRLSFLMETEFYFKPLNIYRKNR